jgi:hypothetical protein
MLGSALPKGNNLSLRDISVLPEVALAHYGWLSKERDAMKIPDYIAIGVLILLLVWAVADQFPRGKL